MTAKEMLGKVDHTQLKAFATWEDIQKLCDEAIQYHTASVCVPPCYIKRIHDTYGDKINICTVVGFPLGYSVTEAKVAEVRKALKDVVIVAKAPSEGYGVAQLHWLVGDGRESIVIECQADGMHVYDDGLDVLTNQPPFPWHTENVRNYMHIETAHPEPVAWTRDTLRAFGSGAGMIGFPGGYDPASRFVRAAFLNAHYPAEEGEAANVTRLFRTLEGASMCKGGAQMADGRFEYTMFSDGYSAATKTYYWCTYDEPARQSVCLDDYDLNGAELIRVAA